MTQEETLKLIQDSDLDENLKQTWTTRIQEEGLTDENLAELLEAIQGEINKTFEKMGAPDISNTEEYQKAQVEKLEAVEAAHTEYLSTMDELSEEAKKIQDDALKAVDQLQADAIKLTMEE
ncbi:MAG: hypothetical protein UU08_C0002G0048 [Candidatus Uhrbacteria bacterium GW2011_GWE2_40_58]|nr:MAG: hypothetical protein UT94_C0003G0032 [Candidatus Uhrbacteria bacterium GW2011_GWF2_40_263]KKR68197.1 MAG: hypothetical protein UU08_C0002G0048 [Candidatus Uhrbacteria bacterium GW2011_GWE2_40_58]OGL97650.1 MAG: hypothetical protein A2332_00670 [Candidatus Uhrbacteria bacterium RIFOXYB2_FULL_41_18]HBK34640.1 hypothetical protein [Candidatus Uhrbacteria bacterium]HCB55655.1 hypothetical protein [Candidatus Uhrbacteria bacterium]